MLLIQSTIFKHNLVSLSVIFLFLIFLLPLNNNTLLAQCSGIEVQTKYLGSPISPRGIVKIKIKISDKVRKNLESKPIRLTCIAILKNGQSFQMTNFFGDSKLKDDNLAPGTKHYAELDWRMKAELKDEFNIEVKEGEKVSNYIKEIIVCPKKRWTNWGLRLAEAFLPPLSNRYNPMQDPLLIGGTIASIAGMTTTVVSALQANKKLKEYNELTCNCDNNEDAQKTKKQFNKAKERVYIGTGAIVVVGLLNFILLDCKKKRLENKNKPKKKKNNKSKKKKNSKSKKGSGLYLAPAKNGAVVGLTWNF